MSPLYASSKDYRAAFKVLKERGISSSYWRFLRAHLALAQVPITWRQLGVSMGYAEKTAFTIVNLQYGTFAKLLAHELPPSDPPFKLHLLAEWAEKDDRGEQQFLLRREVVSALKDFSWPQEKGRGRRSRRTSEPNGDSVTQDDVATDSNEPPSRVTCTTTRIVRDTAIVRTLKALHENTCQLCGKRLKLRGGKYYSEGHHLRPLGEPHRGPDVRANIVVLCPNCHALLDFASVELTATQLRTRTGHTIAMEHLDYHNSLARRAGDA